MFNKASPSVKQCGYSLVEVMIAFILIGVASLALLKLQAYVEQKSDFATRSIDALNMAEQKLEWFRTRGASSALSSIGVADYTTDIITGSDNSDPIYSVSWTLEEESLSGALKTISVEVSWSDRKGTTQNIHLDSMISLYSEFSD
ncbi:type IV pilus modification PilV family protein [Vibrio paucivorans]|uniref:Prepilin-type N-terminal cleavage/methylation domain-containing protein n=1 Tax=Vibrio paucivorans TaxID=2829489 RepID=A0A9X3CIM8_9VIBR|nr:prepilin-type N-terminal cleavage/methylation domain-containing protein [Vibrio paucivorans]MCW8335480.1 prepilin-type N-terminal cleavage/methylation domain-containing protein [Vibrio paucivorans]